MKYHYLLNKRISFVKQAFIVGLSLFFFLPVKAYHIRGKVIDPTQKQTLIGANVVVKKDSTTILKTTQTDENGCFSIKDIAEPNISIAISYFGYKGITLHYYGNSSDIDMGTIHLLPETQQLKEVTVIGKRVIQKADKYVIIPSAEEINRVSASISLLNELKLKMPGLRINEALQTITIDGSAPVFMINGKKQPLSKVQGLNHQDILRIEYSNTPDLRHIDDGNGGVINFIMKTPVQGGFIMANTNQAITTMRNRSQLTGSYFKKKSEWSMQYNTTWRDSKKVYDNKNERFIGREYDVIRRQEGLPSTTKDFDNSVLFSYTYMYDPSTMLMASLDLKLHHKKDCEDNRIVEQYGSSVERYTKNYYTNSHYTSPSLDLFFKKALSKTQTIELNSVGRWSNGDYTRGMRNSNLYHQENNTHNNSWNMTHEVLYTQLFKTLSTKWGANYSHQVAENNYAENSGKRVTDKLFKDDIYLYGMVSGSLKSLGYTVGLGGKMYRNATATRSKTFFRLKTTATFNYAMGRNWSLNYLFMYNPSQPSLANFSNVVQTIDRISVQVGNVNVKPSVWTRNRLLLLFNKNHISSSLQTSYSVTTNPLVNTYQYVSDAASPYHGLFMKKTENGKNDRHFNVEYSFGIQNIAQHLSFQLITGWSRFSMEGSNYRHHVSKMYASISLNGYWKHWSAFANIDLAPQYSIWGTNLYSGTKYNYMGVKYHLKNWDFGLRLDNPLTKRGFIQCAENISNVVPSHSEYYISDMANMVELSIQYRLPFGKAYKKASRTLRNKNFDAGVNNEY